MTLKRFMGGTALPGLVYVLLFACTVFTPLSLYTALFLPAPLIWLFTRSEGRRAGVIAGVTWVVFSVGGGWGSLFFVSLAACLFAWALGDGLNRSRVWRGAVLACLVTVAFLVAGIAAIQAAGPSFLAVIAREVQTTLRAGGILGMLSGTSTANLVDQIERELQVYLPGLLVVMGGLAVLANLAVVRLLSMRCSAARPPLLRAIRFPPAVVGIYAIGLLFVIFGPGNVPVVAELSGSAWIICTFLLNVQALSLIWWRLSRRRYGWIVQLCSVAGAMVPLVSDAYVFIGILDSMIDFRKRSGTKS